MSNLNTSGKRPLEYKVLISIDEVEEKTASGIILVNEEYKEKHQFAKTEGVLVAMGALAFKKDNGDDWVDAPKVGDRIAIATYAGYVIKGKDGKQYRLVSDREILYVEE
jgi:co-chaperonin GroES (HSP10)